MQTHFTPFGRIELDPAGIPAPGRTLREGEAFARELQARLDEPTAHQASDEASNEPVDATTPPPDPAAIPAEVAPEAAEVAGAQAAVAPVAPEPRPAPAAEASAAIEVTNQPRAATSTTAKPTEAPAGEHAAPTMSRTSAAPRTEQPTKGTAGPTLTPLTATTTRSTGPTQVSLAGRDVLRSHRTAITAAAGYRSTDKLAAQRFEAARDSVLKQITFKLQDGQSEARIRLEPPELGQLDLRLAVDAAGQTRLSVVTERPELAALLSLHLTSLTAALQAQGLNVAHADVRSRGGRSPFTPPDPLAASAAVDDDGAQAPLPVLRARGFVSASGLDFWV